MQEAVDAPGERRKGGETKYLCKLPILLENSSAHRPSDDDTRDDGSTQDLTVF